MSRQTKANMRYIATIVLAYLLSLFMILTVTCAILINTVFSDKYMIDRVERSGFVQKAQTEVQEIYISHATASGVSKDMILSVLRYEHVNDAIKAEIRAAYRTGDVYDYKRYEDEIFEALHDYATELGFEETPELDESIRDLAVLCVKDFKTHTISPLLGMIGNAAFKYNRYVSAVFAGAIILTLTIAVALPRLNRRISRWVSAYIYALGATTITCAAIPIFVFSSGFAGRINITPQSYNDLIRSWIEGIARGYVVALIPVLILLAGCLTVWIIRRSKRYYWSNNGTRHDYP